MNEYEVIKMTKKRYRKLARAYFTRLNEHAKANKLGSMKMGQVYKAVRNLENPDGMTREEWWNKLSSTNVFGTFGVGVKGGK